MSGKDHTTEALDCTAMAFVLSRRVSESDPSSKNGKHERRPDFPKTESIPNLAGMGQ
jgi:hypothetical protein